MAKQRNAFLDFLLGSFTGFVSTWAFAGLTGTQMICHRPHLQHAPIRELGDFTWFYIPHGGNFMLCWSLLISITIAVNLLIFLSSSLKLDFDTSLLDQSEPQFRYLDSSSIAIQKTIP